MSAAGIFRLEYLESLSSSNGGALGGLMSPPPTSAAGDARAQSDHDTLLAIHTLTSEVHTINEQQSNILNFLAEKTNMLDTGNSGPTTTQEGSE